MLNLESEIEDFDRTLAIVTEFLTSTISNELNQKSLVWIYSVLKRSQDTVNTADASFKTGHFVSASLLTRALIENAAILNAFGRECSKLDWSQEPVYVDEIAMKFILSSRANLRVKAVNILTHLDKYSKEINPHIRETYDHLSNWCHPNFEGTFNPYVDLSSGQPQPKGSPSKLDQATLSSCLPISVASVRIEAIKAVGTTLSPDVRKNLEKMND